MDYQLLPHEYMVMNSDHVSFGKNGLSTDELILTNLHLIHIKKGFWGGKKDQVTIPINQIKILKETTSFSNQNQWCETAGNLL